MSEAALQLVDRSPARRRTLGLGLILLAVIGAYSGSLHGDFQFDDETSIVSNALVRESGSVALDQAAEPWFSSRWITQLTFRVTHRLWGLDAVPYHATNLLIHLGVVVLVYGFSVEVFERAGRRDSGALALVVTGLFGLHPLQTQAVSYLSQRAEALAALFYLAGLLCLARSLACASPWREASYLLAAGLAFVLGLGAKEVAVTLPIAGLMYVLCIVRRGGRAPATAKGRIGLGALFAVLAAAPGGYLVLRFARGLAHGQDVGYGIAGVTPWEYLLTQSRVLLTYLRLTVWPLGQNLDHDFALSRSLLEPATLASCLAASALLGGGVAGCLWARRQGDGEGTSAVRVAAFGLCWFFVTLAPTSSVVPVRDVIVEHRMYLALWGVLSTLVVAVSSLRTRAPWLAGQGARRALAAGIVALMVAAAAMTQARNTVWSSKEALWSDVVRKSPGKSRPHLNYGHALAQRGEFERALAEFRRALELSGDGATDPASIHNDMAISFLELKRPDEAEASARRALQARPQHGGAHNTMGEILYTRQDYRAALGHFLSAAVLDPYAPTNTYNVAVTHERLGNTPEACRHWRRYIALEMRDAAAREAATRHVTTLACGAR